MSMYEVEQEVVLDVKVMTRETNGAPGHFMAVARRKTEDG